MVVDWSSIRLFNFVGEQTLDNMTHIQLLITGVQSGLMNNELE